MTTAREKVLVSIGIQAVIAAVFVGIEILNGPRSVPAPAWLVTPLDAWLPLLPWSVWIYVSWYAMPALLLSLSPERFRRAAAAVLVAFLASALGWALLPLTMDRPLVDSASGPSGRVLAAVYAIDRPRNILPSFHATVCAIVLGVVSGSSGARRLLAAWTAAICASCVLTKQHYVLDVVAGFAIGRLALAAVDARTAFAKPLLTRRPKMLHTHRVGIRRMPLAGVVVGVVLASAVDAAAQWLSMHQCAPDNPNCCASLPTNVLTSKVCTADAPRAPDRPNVLMIVSDDNGYCHLGFMQGMCTESTFTDCSVNGPYGEGRCWPASEDGDFFAQDDREWCVHGKCIKPCLSNVGCTGSCWSTDQFYAAYPTLTDLPVRLADESCRNRFPIKAFTVEEDPNRGIFPFSRTMKPQVDAHMITPHIDELASQGVVFSHGYTGGQRCQPGRTVLWNGLAVVHRNQGDVLKTGRHCALEPDFKRLDPSVIEYDTELGAGIGCYLHNLSHVRNPPQTAQDEDYRTFLFGKRDIVGTHRNDFDTTNLGANSTIGAAPNSCDDDPASSADTCMKRIRRGLVPFDMRRCGVEGDLSSCPEWRTSAVGIERMFSRIEKVVRKDLKAMPITERTVKPMYMWFAPNVPHDKAPSPGFLIDWYPDIRDATSGVDPLAQEFVARVSLLDTSVGAVTDGLKRRCICTSPVGATTPQAQSLWENTLVLFVNDNGNYLPDSKRQLTENGERTPIIISDPATRQHVLRRNELASGMDVVRTLVSYAQGSAPVPNAPYGCGSTDVPALGVLDTTFAFGYPFAGNLCHTARGTESEHVRSIYMTNLSFDGTDLKDHARVLVTRPGELGVCLNGNDPVPNSDGHVLLCRRGSSNQCNGGTCTVGLSPTKGGRCSNRPDTACAIDRDCAASWCYEDSPGGGKTCHNCMGPSSSDPCCPDPVNTPCPPYPSDHQYPEFNGKACVDHGSCVPKGVCQQPVLRFVTDVTGAGERQRLFDPNWDPDENFDLYGGHGPSGSNYITPALEDELDDCLDRFWELERHQNTSNPYQPLVWNEFPWDPDPAHNGCRFASYQ